MAYFSVNLQRRRMAMGLTQEQLAEQMGVTRQTVSKWESSASYPEMEKLLALCDLFGCTLDELVRGELPQPAQYAEYGAEESIRPAYERAMGRTAWGIAVGVALLIASVAVNQFFSASGTAEALGTIAMFLTVALGIAVLIISGSGRGRFRQNHPILENFYSDAEREKAERRFPVRLGAGIALIFLGLCTVVFGEEFPAPFGWAEDFYTGVFLLMAACGVGTIIFSGLKKDQVNIAKYNRTNAEDPDIPMAEGMSVHERRKNRIMGGVCGIIMMAATILFLVAGFTTQMWHIAAVVFPVGAILCGIAAVLYSIFDKSQEEK